jgi:hypothetical protein
MYLVKFHVDGTDHRGSCWDPSDVQAVLSYDLYALANAKGEYPRDGDGFLFEVRQFDGKNETCSNLYSSSRCEDFYQFYTAIWARDCRDTPYARAVQDTLDFLAAKHANYQFTPSRVLMEAERVSMWELENQHPTLFETDEFRNLLLAAEVKKGEFIDESEKQLNQK